MPVSGLSYAPSIASSRIVASCCVSGACLNFAFLLKFRIRLRRFRRNQRKHWPASILVDLYVTIVIDYYTDCKDDEVKCSAREVTFLGPMHPLVFMHAYPEVACAKISTSEGCAGLGDALLNIAYVPHRGRQLFGGIRERLCFHPHAKDPWKPRDRMSGPAGRTCKPGLRRAGSFILLCIYIRH